MAIERFAWTNHAQMRLAERHLDGAEIERAIHENDVVSERVPGGLCDYDRTTHKLVAIEVWDASTRLPASFLESTFRGTSRPWGC
jgi:hypothetical protein